VRTHRNHYKPVEVLHEEQIERIHDASMRILEEFGIEFLDAQARERASPRGGAGPRHPAPAVRPQPGRGICQQGAAEFMLHARCRSGT